MPQHVRVVVVAEILVPARGRERLLSAVRSMAHGDIAAKTLD
jgi:hypothetical protein